MRIAYVAPYQGAALAQRRPIVGNLSLAGRVKVEVIAQLLQRQSHEVEVLSQGEIIENKLKIYPGFIDPAPFASEIPVYYASGLPVKFVNVRWSALSLLRLFKARHRIAPYDALLIYNLKIPQVVCAKYAHRRLEIPVILEYEDDAFVDTAGQAESRLRVHQHLSTAKEIFNLISAGIAVSPHLLRQLPCSIPKVLLRGVVSDEITNAEKPPPGARKNRVVFSGTLSRTKGLEQLITAWAMMRPPGWELHIAGHGELTVELKRMAEHDRSIVFRGVLDLQENARLLFSAKIGMNPHDLSDTPGNVFAFKIVEYLACGLHVITTPMGPLEPELEEGITYMTDNDPDTIAATLRKVIAQRAYEGTAEAAAQKRYGAATVSKLLDELVRKVVSTRGAKSSTGEQSPLVDRCIG